ncbi:MAG: outer membrane protein assembly factor BamD [Candidatus Koribacter versatilis]|uniref:Outer membrane protein assembly factor BamD n=1 Tax=Candidatus Korobacter versatilis TaxID=658062 RepID=A0A932A831_9BACT|nr:outer membrane protein assembly factor BamD [Candidatus Koribacter versatilis]
MKLARLAAMIVVLAVAAQAAIEKGIPIRETTVYISPDRSSQRIGVVPRGRETNILETSPGWLHVFVTTDQGKDVSGWAEDKGMVRPNTPNGDRVLFGEAVDSESEAQKRHGRKGADIDAGRLYMRIAEFFPSSPLAGEAMYRAADIRWQLDSIDVWTRPSAKEQDPIMRPKIEETLMKQVKKKFPGTKWADLADYAMIDNKICGDWKGESKCPEKETEIYTKYVEEHPKSPKAAEALYNAAWRQSALVEIYKTEENAGKSAAAKSKAAALAQRIVSSYPESDYATRAQRLVFMVDQGLPTYGSPSD